MGTGTKMAVLAALCWLTSGTPMMDPSPSDHVEESRGLFINGRPEMKNFHRHRRSFWEGLLEVLRDTPDSYEASADLLARTQRDARTTISSFLYSLLGILGHLVGLLPARPVNYPVPCKTPTSYQQDPRPAQVQYQAPQSGSRNLGDFSVDKIVDIVGKLMKKQVVDPQNYE